MLATRPAARAPLIRPVRTIVAASVAALLFLLMAAALFGWLQWTTPRLGRDARQDEQQKQVVELLQTGYQSLRIGDPMRAVSAFRQAEQIAPEKQKPRLSVLRRAAERQAQEFAERQKRVVDYLATAQQAMNNRRYNEAVAAADAALALEPANTQAQQVRTAAPLVIQVFSSPIEADAQRILTRLQLLGHSAYFSPVTVAGRIMYRVRVGPFWTKESASRSAEGLRKLKLDTWVTTDRWAIRAFSSPDEPQAQRIAAKLQELGHNTSISPLRAAGSTVYRVTVHCSTLENAVRSAEGIRRKAKLDTWISDQP